MKKIYEYIIKDSMDDLMLYVNNASDEYELISITTHQDKFIGVLKKIRKSYTYLYANNEKYQKHNYKCNTFDAVPIRLSSSTTPMPVFN